MIGPIIIGAHAINPFVVVYFLFAYAFYHRVGDNLVELLDLGFFMGQIKSVAEFVL